MIYKKERPNLNPHLCNMCEQFARQHQRGADIDLSLLFADVRGSTKLAEDMPPLEYSRLINRFFDAVTRVMVRSDALTDKIIGDQLAAMYVPAFAGAKHARRALQAAQQVLAATGHGAGKEPWIPLGVGVHSGNAFVGAVLSEDGASDITVLGDAANTAARLASEAERGEILVSAAAAQEAGLQVGGMERCKLALKGKSQPTSAYRSRAGIGIEFNGE
jgi:adenylate cyclase